jgi:hypothetical protein
VTRSIGRIAGPTNGALAKIARVPAEAALVDASLGCAVKRQTAVFQIVDGLDSLFGKYFCRLLINEVVTALDRVEGVPFGFVLLHIAQCGTDPALSRTGMAADGIQLGENRRFGLLAGFQCGV